MSIGDTVTGGLYNVANNGTTTIQPTGAIEWLIHTLGSGNAKNMEVYFTPDGTNFVLVETLLGGSVHGLTWRVTNTAFLQLKNVSGGAALNFYNGVITK